MVAFAEPRRPTRRAPVRPCEGSAPCAPVKTPTLRTDRNQQYSVTALTNGGASIQERYAYTAYGAPTITDASGTPRTTTAEGNRYTYTGREWDEELSLYHYRARMYDPAAGRFLGRDPIGYVGSPWNLYEYVNGRPLIFVDPNGQLVQIVGGTTATGAAVGGPPGAVVGAVVGGVIVVGVGIWWWNQEPEVEPIPLPVPVPDPEPVDTDCEEDPLRKPVRCKKASPFHLHEAGIDDAHDFKTGWGAVPNSKYDICACTDGSISIAAQGKCGKPGPKIDTDVKWRDD